jgi:S-adenosylhomocysteine hydrolase
LDLKYGWIYIPKPIDDRVGVPKLDALNVAIDKLTEEQYTYIHGYESGT